MTDTQLAAPEVAQILGITVNRLYRLRAQNRGPRGHLRGNRLVFYRSDVDRYQQLEEAATTRGGYL